LLQVAEGQVDERMVRENVGTVAEAAKRLVLDLSALKSIRSSRGKLRYGEETLNRVLKTIDYKGT
jgi:hypothetical protein